MIFSLSAVLLSSAIYESTRETVILRFTTDSTTNFEYLLYSLDTNSLSLDQNDQTTHIRFLLLLWDGQSPNNPQIGPSSDKNGYVYVNFSGQIYTPVPCLHILLPRAI